MLQSVYHIIDQATLQPGQVTKNIIAIKIDRKGATGISNAYQSMSNSNGAQLFCLYLELENGEALPAVDLISFFFLPGYYKEKEFPVMVTDGRNIDALSSLLPAAEQQGFKGISIQAIPTASEVYSMEEAELLSTAYQAALKEAAAKNFFIDAAGWSAVTAADLLLEGLEEFFKKENRNIFNLQQENRKLKSSFDEMELRISAADAEIRTLQSHVVTLQSGAQAKHLQQYYNNEYEVLPVWFKRLGHIVKVFQGKRNFKSLFSDKEKKYKN